MNLYISLLQHRMDSQTAGLRRQSCPVVPWHQAAVGCGFSDLTLELLSKELGKQPWSTRFYQEIQWKKIMSTTDCCQECRTFLEHADDLVATCTWRVHPWETWSFSPACYFCAPEISEPKCRWFRSPIWCLPCHWSKGMDTSGMDDFPYRNLQYLKANVGVHLLADFLVPGPCQAFQQGEVFQVLSWCKTHDFFRKFGVMKMVLASARKKGAGTIVRSFFFGGLMDFDPRLSFCAIFSSTVRCQRSATYWTWKWS